MRNFNPKPFAYLLFVAFAICLILVALFTGHKINDIQSAIIASYKTIPILLGLAWLFTAFGWRWKVLQDWLVPFPDLNGTWQGQLQTTWKNPETNQAPVPIPVILTIKQSFTKISCVMRSAEMTSQSYLAGFWIDSDEQVRMLGYCYTSKPSIIVSERSKPHDGTITFEIIGNPANKLKGTYWNDRESKGEVVLTFRTTKQLDDFPEDMGAHPVTESSQ